MSGDKVHACNALIYIPTHPTFPFAVEYGCYSGFVELVETTYLPCNRSELLFCYYRLRTVFCLCFSAVIFSLQAFASSSMDFERGNCVENVAPVVIDRSGTFESILYVSRLDMSAFNLVRGSLQVDHPHQQSIHAISPYIFLLSISSTLQAH